VGLTAAVLRASLAGRRRALKLRTGRAADMLFPAWASLVVLIRFALNCSLAVREFRAGTQAVGLVLAEFCQLHALGVGLVFSFLGATLSLGADRLNRRRLALCPVAFPRLLAAELLGLLASPAAIAASVFVVPAAVTLVLTGHGAAALACLLLCFAACILLGAALATALTASPRAAGIGGPLRAASAVVLVGLVLANFDFAWREGSVSLSVFTQRTLLDDGAGGGLLPGLGPWSPSAWIAGRGTQPALALPASAGFGAGAALLFALGLRSAMRAAARGVSGEAGGSGRARSLLTRILSPRPPRPPRAAARADTRSGLRAALLRRELVWLLTRGATLAGAGASLGFALWSVLAPVASASIPLFGAVTVLGSVFPYVSNMFGADGKALGRILMAAPDWGIVLGCRLAAYAAACAALLAPLVAASAVRLSPWTAAAVAATALLAAALHGLWGTVSSMLLPSALSPGRAQPAAFASLAAHAAAWLVPLFLHRTVARMGTPGYAAVTAACAAAAVLLWLAMVRRARAHLGGEVEAILARM
jgi:hypothetical protein